MADMQNVVETPKGPVVLRPLDKTDRDRGIFELLAQLTKAPKLSNDQFQAILQRVEANEDHFIYVAHDYAGAQPKNGGPGDMNKPEDTAKGSELGETPLHEPILATAALLIERKLLRGGGLVGHIEDVVVDEKARGKRLGKLVVEKLSEIAKEQGCYKVILDCSEDNAGFYERCGFEKKEIQMARYF